MAQDAVLVADEAEALHPAGVELHLDLHILRDHLERAHEPLAEHPEGLVLAVHEGVVAVGLVGQRLDEVVVEAVAVAQHGHVDAAISPGDHLVDEGLAGDADVEVAVGAEYHPVDAVRAEGLLSQGVRPPQAPGAVRAAAAPEAVDGVEDHPAAEDRRRRQQGGLPPRVGDDGERVRRLEAVGEQLQRVLHQPQLVGARHGARDVDEEDEVGRGPRLGRDLHALEADLEHVLVLAEGGGRRVEVHGEGVLILWPRGRVVVAEEVDELLDPDLRRLWERARGDALPSEGVAGGVHVDGEGGEGILRGVDEVVLYDLAGSRRVHRWGHVLAAAPDGGAAGLATVAVLVFVAVSAASAPASATASAAEAVPWIVGAASVGDVAAGLATSVVERVTGLILITAGRDHETDPEGQERAEKVGLHRRLLPCVETREGTAPRSYAGGPDQA